MSKLNSTNSYNSGTSSETSETPSVEENQPSDSVTAGSVTPPIPGSGSRIPKSWKRMKEPNNDKDGESKRPPWRAVSISTLPKPDKNALLRAKLLDASRRLRAGKVAVGVQTDIVPTKLMKEVSLGAQTDLILLKEVGVLTDGSYTKTRGGSDEYILTYSVPLMTDPIETECVSTQTLIPRYAGDTSFEVFEGNIKSHESELIQKCFEVENQLIKQLEMLRGTENPLTAHYNELRRNEITSHVKENIISPGETDTDTTTETIRSFGPTEIIPKQSLDYNKYRPKLSYPTKLYWHFEYDPDLIAYSKKFSAYTITANQPWDSFLPVSYSHYQGIDLNSLLESIDQLIVESYNLAGLIEHVVQSRNCSEHSILDSVHENLSNFVPYVHIPPSDYWLPIIEVQEKALAELQSFECTDMTKLEKYLEKM